ncbi:hypothetical protein JL721_12111 [Aureococcus anophagefferens]|nr:hypothetical protein JL721_12111 [Aureococcus anophagefferens]
MEDEWMEALHRYVSEGQWSEVSHFVDRNAVLFGGSSTEKEHGEGEYALYVQFRSLVAKVLDSLLEELGCRSEADEARLAIFLRETAESPASGPREEMAKRVLQDLLDIDDFAAFARTMRARNDDDSDADLTPVTTPGGGVDWQWSTVWEEAFESAEAANDDFELQHATALSLLEAHERGALPDKDRPFVGWAQALVAVASEMNGLHWAQEPRRARRLHSDLVRQRAVELRVAQEAAFEDSAARAEAAQSAAVGGDDERSARAEAEAEAHRRGDAAGPDGDGDGDIGDIGDGRRGARGAAPSAIAADLVAWCALEAELGTVQKRLHGMLGDDGASDQAKAAAVWKLAARRGADDKAAEARFLDLDTNYCYYVNTATGESQWNPPDEFLPLDESVEVAAGLAEEQAAAYHAEAAHAAYKEELPTSEYWDEPKAAKDPPHAPEADAAPTEAKAEAKDDGPTFKVPESFRGLSIETKPEFVSPAASRMASSPSKPTRAAFPPPIGLPVSPSPHRKMSTWDRRLPPLPNGAPGSATGGVDKGMLLLSPKAFLQIKRRFPRGSPGRVMLRVVARLDGPCIQEMNIGERSIEYEGKKMQFDAVYAGLSDEGFFAAACEPVLECDRGTFLCSGACAEVSKAIAFFADAFETASAVDVREDRVWDVLANGELAVDSKTKKFRRRRRRR